MKQSNVLWVIFLITIFCFTEFSCARHYEYDEVKVKYNTRKVEFEKLTKIFLNQDACLSILRNDFSKSPSIFSTSNYYIIYWIAPSADSRSYEVFISKEFEGNEDKFWEKDYKEIKENESEDLETFLNKYGISHSFFEECKNFLKVNELYGIQKERGSTYLVIRFGEIDGLIYQPEKDTIPKYPMAKEIKKIDDNWYYFRQW